MTTEGQIARETTPDWVVADMPSGYHNRLAEIQRLTADLQSMGKFGQLLTGTGSALGDIVRDLFASLHMEASLLEGVGATGVTVRLQGRGRLLLHVSADADPVQKKSPEVAHVFQMLHELAEEQDRVVLVTNIDPATRPGERRQPLTDEATSFLRRLGVTHVTAPMLFALWKLSLPEPERAREQVQRLHGHEGGTFELPASARV